MKVNLWLIKLNTMKKHREVEVQCHADSCQHHKEVSV